MARNIPLSPKHGLNPTIPVCAWCGEDKNEIALLGKIKGSNDAEAPMHCVLDYEPCEHCKEQWSQGVAVLEVTTKGVSPYRPPIQKDNGNDLTPTMRMVCVRAEVASDIFGGEFKPGNRLLLEDEAFEKIFGEALRGEQS
jgi:hypothetical protein